MRYDNIPDELKALKQWGLYQLVWQEDRQKYTKIPRNAFNGGEGKTNDSSTWCDFDTALEALQDYGFDGLGFYFANGYAGIDLDHVEDDIERCLNGDLEKNIVDEFMSHVKSYTEKSVSGTGIHIIFKGTIPGSRRRKGNVEMYSETRFFAMTGDQFGSYNTINECDITPLYKKYLAPKTVVPMNQTAEKPVKNDLSEHEVIQNALDSRTGTRFKLFLNGGWEQFYSSQSEADMAFANDLAFWTGKDFAMMDSIFRESSLMREKWDTKRGQTTYGIATLNKAISEVGNVFQPKKQKPKYKINFGSTSEKNVQYPSHTWDDTGNAERFLDRFGDITRYSYVDKKWHIYNGMYWETDNTGESMKLADLMVDSMKNEKLKLPPDTKDDDKEKIKSKWLEFISKSRGTRSKKNFMEQVQYRTAVSLDIFDADSMLLNTQNGYIDLNSGELFDHDQSKLFSQIANFEYSENIDCPTWEKFLNQIFDGNKELIHYIQKAVGYSMTGSVKEQVMFFLYGNGRNGKSVFLDIISDILGTYAKTIQSNSIMVRQNTGGANSDIARLKGARLVTSSEPNENAKLDEGLIKQLTGGDKITARKLYGDEFEFSPEFKLWLATNHKPIIRGTDEGIWRRIALIPFTVYIEDKDVDLELPFKLKRESIGILNWMVDGALMWQKEGLEQPEVIKENTRVYREEMDVIESFLGDRAVKGPGYQEQASLIYKEYRNWAEENNQYAMNSTKFGREMEKKFKKKKTKQFNVYEGFKLTKDQRMNFIN